MIAAALIAPPGAEAITALARIDPEALSDSAQTDLLIAWELQTRWMAAHNQPLLVAVGSTVESQAYAGRQSIDNSDMPIRAAHAEIAAALLITEVTASIHLETARILTTELPDVLAALAAGLAPAAGYQVQVNLTIDLPTLLGIRDRPGELTGYGPIPAPLARALAADGKWRRLIHDPFTGHLLDLGDTRYEPSAALSRYIHARDQTCAFPTCNRPAINTDLDHTRRYAPNDPGGGRTDRNNLGPCCESHHRLKHETNWTLELHSGYFQTVRLWPLNDFHQLPDPIAPMDDMSYQQEPADEYALV